MPSAKRQPGCSRNSPPWLLAALLCATVGACALQPSPNVSWRVEFACAEDASRAQEVKVTIAENDCGAPGPVAYEGIVTRNGTVDAADPGKYDKGTYAFAASALDERGAVIASGCVSVMLPQSSPVVVPLTGGAGCKVPAPRNEPGQDAAIEVGLDAGVDAGVVSGDSAVATGPRLEIDADAFDVGQPIPLRYVDVTKPGAPFIGLFAAGQVDPLVRFVIRFPRKQDTVSGTYELPPQPAGTYFVRLVYDSDRVAHELTVRVVGDQDGDGANDLVDGCSTDPGKTEPGVCGCGQPESADRDGDKLADCVDKCPDDRLKSAPGTCGCGFLDSYLDQDSDGLSDCFDACPGDRKKVQPRQCGCGALETDTDGDGTADCVDPCPMDGAKREPGTCGCGSPDTDADHDNVPACLDQCEMDPAKVEPGLCGCGVAESTCITNLALGKPTNQSSTEWGGDSARAVDGNTDGNWSANSTTHTVAETGAWWSVDLGVVSTISQIVIYNRTDCCADRLSSFSVEVRDANNQTVSRQSFSGVAGQQVVFDFPNVRGRIIVVQLDGTNVLSLAEVQVMGI